MKNVYNFDEIVDLNFESISCKASFLVKGGGGEYSEIWRPTRDPE